MLKISLRKFQGMIISPQNIIPYTLSSNKLGYELKKGDYMLNNFALSKMALEKENQEGLADHNHEEVLVHNDHCDSPVRNERWKIRRRSSAQLEESIFRYDKKSYHLS